MLITTFTKCVTSSSWKRGEANLSSPVDKFTGREIIPDYLKAIAIIGVVWIHAGAPGANLFRFCVPVFIGIWALYFERALKKAETVTRTNSSGIIRQRLLHLVVPFGAWTLFYLTQKYNLSEFFMLPAHTLILGQLGGFGFAGQYFFIVLFQLHIIFPILRKFVKKENFAVLIASSLVFNWMVVYLLSDWSTISKLGYRPFIYWLPYTIGGIAIAKGFVRRISILAFLIPPMIAIIPIELSRQNELAVYTAISVSIASMLLLMMCVPYPGNTRQPKWLTSSNYIFSALDTSLRYIGENTYPIFLTNIFFLSYANLLGTGATARLTSVIIAVCGGLVVGYTFRRLGLGMFVGRPIRRNFDSPGKVKMRVSTTTSGNLISNLRSLAGLKGS